MKRRKNLERAVILGLLLSTSVYSSAFAVKPINETITDGSHNGTYNEDVIVDAGNNSAIEIDEDTISISTTTENLVENETGKIELNSNKYGIRLDGSGSVYLTAVGDNVIKVTANSTNKEIGDGINVTENAGGTITLNGANNTITVEGEHSDGIYTAAGSITNIGLIATAGSNTITATNNGIDHRGNGTITLKAENGSNVIKTTNGDGIRVEGTGTVEFIAQNNEITAGDNGIQVEDGGTVNVTATGNNTITANTNGIYASGVNSVVNLIGNVNKITVNGTDETAMNNAILAENNSTINIVDGGNLELNLNKTPYYIDDPAAGDNVSGLRNYGSNLNINTGNGFVDINVVSNTVKHMSESTGISLNTWETTDGANYGDATTTISGKYVDINVSNNIQNVSGNIVTSGAVYGIHLNDSDKENEKRANLTLTANGYYTDTINEEERNIGINIIANNDGYVSDPKSATAVGVKLNGNAEAVITANSGDVNISANSKNSYGYGIQANGYANSATNLNITGVNTNINGSYAAAFIQGSLGENTKTEVKLKATGGNNKFKGESFGIYNQYGASTEIEAISGFNSVVAGNSGTAIYSYGKDTTVKLIAKGNSLSANTGIWGTNNGQVTLTANNENNEIITSVYGIYADTDSDVDLIAQENNNIIKAGNYGIYINDSEIELTANKNSNIIKSGVIDEKGFGNKTAIYALSGSNVNLTAANKNDIAGWVYAYGDGTTIDLKGVNDKNVYNSVLSSTGVNGAGGLKDITVVSALFADNKSNINLSGINNIQTYYDDPEDTHTSERAVWAYKGADINIDGLTTIKTYLYEKSPNSMDLAIAAGTATNLDFDTVNANNPEEGMAIVDIDYDSYTYDDNGVERTAVSSIEGDILAAYGGIVDIAPKSADTVGINITGNLLAGNNGDLTVNLGNGGVLTGRADDYGDANVEGTTHGAGKDNGGFFNPAFSSEIITGGEVNLTMGEGSTWNVTGQSWITELKTNGTINDTYIDLVNAKTDLNTNASALTIGTLNGDTTFHMNLDGNRSASDMLYIKNADGKYQIDLAKAVTNDDINKDGFDGLRFATVGTGSNVEFTVGSYDDGGAFNVEYTVDTDSYEGNTENTAYNSTTDGSANVEKPGNASVDDFFGLTNNAVEDDSEIATNGIMLMAENEEAADNAANANGGLDEVTNFKIIARADEELNDTGETILNMSRANYSNAIYMDRLNKRLGEARYINDDPEEDEGMWVRIRHDRIGKDDAYRSQNTMYELGYDKKQDCDNGERRVGFAVDYMHGDTGYTDIAGKGEIDRYGLWLYDTWMGDKGHYVDYVAKWGHLDNDFEVYTMRDGNKVTGDYSNNVFSVSAEYGRKKDIGNDWYFEPQAQLQLARVTGADYTTNQGTKVSVDGINSLIGRAGFRIGKDFGEEKQSTLYFKADVLHEFYAAMMSKSSYAFIDLEQSFGNDNDDTYQINAGVRWTF